MSKSGYARGKNPNSLANLKHGPTNGFTKENASERGRKAVEAKKAYKTFRQAAKEALTPDKMACITSAMIDKAMAGDTKAYELLRDTVGERPSDALELSGSGVKFVLGTADDGDELSG